MITAAGIDDQELAIAAELASINDPAIAGRHDLAAVARLDHNALGLAAVLGLFAEREDPPALRGQRQLALGLAKGMAGLMRPGVSMATRSPLGASTTDELGLRSGL